MSSDTFTSRYIWAVLADQWRGELEKCVIAEAGIYPGMAIRMSAGSAYLTKDTDMAFAGVVRCEEDHTIDTAYSVGDVVYYYPKGSGATVWMWFVAYSDGTKAIQLEPGDKMVLSPTDGMIVSAKHYLSVSGGHIYDESLLNIVGVVKKRQLGHLTLNRLVEVKI